MIECHGATDQTSGAGGAHPGPARRDQSSPRRVLLMDAHTGRDLGGHRIEAPWLLHLRAAPTRHLVSVPPSPPCVRCRATGSAPPHGKSLLARPAARQDDDHLPR